MQCILHVHVCIYIYTHSLVWYGTYDMLRCFHIWISAEWHQGHQVLRDVVNQHILQKEEARVGKWGYMGVLRDLSNNIWR